MGIELKYEGDEIYTIFVDGIELEYDGVNFITPKHLFKDKQVNDIPLKTQFSICWQHIDNVIHLDTIPYYLVRTGDDKIAIYFEDSGRRKYWDGEYGFKIYMETKRDIINEREKELGDIKFVDYNDDGDYIFLNYTLEINQKQLGEVIETAEQMVSEIEGAVELTLGYPFKKLVETENEKDFTLSLVIPLIRKLGFINVRYNHGKREFGKDVIFSRKTEFDDYEFWGAQIKWGNISGSANSEIDMIISQIDDAMKMPFYDVYTRRKEKLSKIAIIISGKFSENAVEKICEKIENNAVKNNVVFIDSDKINSLSEKFRKNLQ